MTDLPGPVNSAELASSISCFKLVWRLTRSSNITDRQDYIGLHSVDTWTPSSCCWNAARRLMRKTKVLGELPWGGLCMVGAPRRLPGALIITMWSLLWCGQAQNSTRSGMRTMRTGDELERKCDPIHA